MTDNPIDMAIELLEYVESHGVVLDIDECEYVKDTLKTYRDEYISIKKSDVPAHPISNSVQDWNRYTNKCVYLITQALEAENE